MSKYILGRGTNSPLRAWPIPLFLIIDEIEIVLLPLYFPLLFLASRGIFLPRCIFNRGFVDGQRVIRFLETVAWREGCKFSNRIWQITGRGFIAA